MTESLDLPSVRQEIREIARGHSRWLIGAGALTMLFGLLCIAAPLVSGLGVNVVVGVLFLLAGWVEVLGGARLRKGTKGRGWMVFGGALSILLGIYMLARPLQSLLALTWVLCIVFVVQGVLRCLSAFELRPLRGWGWMLFSGAVTVLLGLFLLANWPFSGAWLIGTLFGVYVLMAGWTLLQLGLAARSLSE